MKQTEEPDNSGRDIAEAMGMRPGRRIRRTKLTMTAEELESGTKVKRSGVVTDMYRWIFRVKWDEGGFYECFRYSDLTATAGERIRLVGGDC